MIRMILFPGNGGFHSDLSIGIPRRLCDREQALTVRSQIGPMVNSKNRPYHAAIGSQRCPIGR
jgi:hypothetical protein